MKNTFKLTLAFILGMFFLSNAQVRIGGGISIDIDLPLPEIVVEKKRPIPAPQRYPKQKRKQRTVNRPVYNKHSLGSINNQNRRDGSYNYHVINASIAKADYNTESILYEFDNGETLELIIATTNPHDYNYHFYNNRGPHGGNQIQVILLNGYELPAHSASLSLQPKRIGYHSVLNLHSVNEGNFNGTVNF